MSDDKRKTEKRRSIVVNGYAYPNIGPELLAQAAPELTFISSFSYGVREDGGLLPLEDGPLRRLAGQYGLKTLMVVSSLGENGDFDSGLVGRVFRDVKAQDRLIADIAANLKTKTMCGVDFDFEKVTPQDRDTYTQLIRRTAEQLRPQGYITTVALAPKIAPDQKGSIFAGHDYAAIGQVADLVLLMTYEWNQRSTTPTAVAPVDDIRRILNYGISKIPAYKILMGIPNYGYDWTFPGEPGLYWKRSVGNEEALWLATHYGAEIQYDEQAQSPYFFYRDDRGYRHEVWFEDARSIDAKLRLVGEYGLAGVSYWNLMRPFRANWEVLHRQYDVLKL